MIRVERLSPDPPDDGGAAGHDACRAIRQRVFVEEQSVDASEEWDGLDGTAVHFLAWDDTATPPRAVGTARLRRVGDAAKAERVAVLREARGRRIGRALMEAMEEASRAEGILEVRLNAQVAAIPFYEHLGYRAEGPVFLEAGIEHRAMRKPVAPEPVAPTRPAG